MNSKFFKIGMIVLGLSTLLGVSWFLYSIIKFDTFLIPTDVVKLSDPYEYYQEKLGTLLVKNGQEFKIDSYDVSNWEIYANDIYGFKFRYADKFIVKNWDNKTILLCYKLKDSVCPVEIQVFDNLKKVVHGIEKNIKKQMQDCNNEMYYMRLKSGDVYMVSGMVNDFMCPDVPQINNFYLSMIGKDKSLYISVNNKLYESSDSSILNMIETIQLSR